MRGLEEVEVKLLQCKQGSIVLYAFLREHPATLMQMGKTFGYIDVGECAAELLSKGLIEYHGEEVYAK